MKMIYVLLISFYFCIQMIKCDILFNDSIIECWNGNNNPRWYCHNNRCYKQNNNNICYEPPCCSVNKEGYILSPIINITNYINIGIKLYYTPNDNNCYLKYSNNGNDWTTIILPDLNLGTLHGYLYDNSSINDLNNENSIQIRLMSIDGDCTWDSVQVYGTHIISNQSSLLENVETKDPTMEPTHLPTINPTVSINLLSPNPTLSPTIYPTTLHNISNISTYSSQFPTKSPTFSPNLFIKNPTFYDGTINSESIDNRANVIFKNGGVKFALLGVLMLLSIILILLGLLYIVLYKRYKNKYKDNVKNIKQTQNATQATTSIKKHKSKSKSKSAEEGVKTVKIDKPIGSINTDDANYIINICNEINIQSNISPEPIDIGNAIFSDALTMGVIDEDIEQNKIFGDMIIDDIHAKTGKHVQWESISTMNEHRIQNRNINNTYDLNSETLSTSQPKVNTEFDSISNAKHRNGTRIKQGNKSESDIIKLIMNHR